jgi:hypothetical protein
MPEEHGVDELIGKMIVVDTPTPFLYVGRLERIVPGCLVLGEVDAHDLRDTPTVTREQYLVRCRELGVIVNRERVWLAREQVVAVSRLEDVVIR